MMLNNSARLHNAAWGVSFIVANGAFGVFFSNASTKYRAARVSESADETLCTLIVIVGGYAMT